MNSTSNREEMEKVPFTFGLLETEAFVVTIAIAMDTLQVFTLYQLVRVKYKIYTKMQFNILLKAL